MSHTVEIEARVRDLAAIKSACVRLGLEEPIAGKAALFEGEVAGVVVKLRGWQYPIVCELASGAVSYDNFGGRWGDQARLNVFLQAYSVEKAKLEARRRGHVVTEQRLTNGAIKLTVHVATG